MLQWAGTGGKPGQLAGGGAMKTLKAIRPVAGGFLKKYELHYDADGQDVCWEVISLNDLKTEGDLACRNTAVEIIARFEDGDYLLDRKSIV